MVAETIIKKLGLEYPGRYVDEDTFEIELDNDSDFGKVYSALDHAAEFEVEDDGVVDMDTVHLVYISEEFGCRAVVEADFNENIYTLTIYEE